MRIEGLIYLRGCDPKTTHIVAQSSLKGLRKKKLTGKIAAPTGLAVINGFAGLAGRSLFDYRGLGLGIY